MSRSPRDILPLTHNVRIGSTEEGQDYPAPQDAVSEDATLNELLIKIKTDIEKGLGKTEKAWRGLMTQDAIRLHEVLLSLRHWEDDIRNDAGVLSALEPDTDHDVSAPFEVLAARVRSFLTEIHENIEQIGEVCAGDGDDTTGFDDAVESSIEELEHTVECLRTLVEPLQMVFEAITKGNLVRAPATPAHTLARGIVGITPERKWGWDSDTEPDTESELDSEPVSGDPSGPKPIHPGPSKATSTATDPGITDPDRGSLRPSWSQMLTSQNPPCNTLDVGNLPIDTSEEELKSLFSKEKGYRRLVFRTKRNGPMCFVEFEDISFAARALSNLYGYKLHNSHGGGIRLSFSKNPLGVRSGLPGPSTSTTTRPVGQPVPGPKELLRPEYRPTRSGPSPLLRREEHSTSPVWGVK